MTKRKLPPAKDWQAPNIDDWNTTTFHAYLSDKHEDMFGCTYAPVRGCQAEKGIIGGLIGTHSTAGTISKPSNNSSWGISVSSFIKAIISEVLTDVKRFIHLRNNSSELYN